MKKKYEISTDIYPKILINKAIEDFKEIANISFEKNYLIINGENSESIEEVFNEIMNYLIGLINQ